MIKSINSYSEFYSMTKKQISHFLFLKGFGCLASLNQSKDDLLFHAINIFRKYGGISYE